MDQDSPDIALKSLEEVIRAKSKEKNGDDIEGIHHRQLKLKDTGIGLSQSILSAIRTLAVTVAQVIEEEITNNVKDLILTKTDSIKNEFRKLDPLKLPPPNTDPEKTEPIKSNPTKRRPPKLGPGKAKLAQIEAAKVEAAKVEAAKVEAAKVEAAKVEAAKVEAAKLELAKIEPAKIEPAKIESTKILLGKRNTSIKIIQPNEHQSSTSNEKHDDEKGAFQSKKELTNAVADSHTTSVPDTALSESKCIIPIEKKGDPKSLENGDKASSGIDPPPPGTGSNEITKCLICLDAVLEDHSVIAPCEHTYCKTCINELFERAIKDRALFPPQCCMKPIGFECAAPVLREDIVKAFEKISVESITENHVSCSNLKCGKLILQSDIHGERAVCASCQRETCSVCKKQAHAGDCPEDPAYKMLLELARKEGYQTCRKCKHMVELAGGCYHVRCTCGTEFCYLCGKLWKTCPCAQFEEHHLIAGVRANNAQAAAPVQPRVLGRFNQVMAAIFDGATAHHRCNRYRYWTRVESGRLRCYACDFDAGASRNVAGFLFKCPDCDLRLCYPCKYASPE